MRVLIQLRPSPDLVEAAVSATAGGAVEPLGPEAVAGRNGGGYDYDYGYGVIDVDGLMRALERRKKPPA